MASSENCFVNQVIEPVQLIDVLRPIPASSNPQAQGSQTQHVQLSTVEELTGYLETVHLDDYSCRLMLVQAARKLSPSLALKKNP